MIQFSFSTFILRLLRKFKVLYLLSHYKVNYGSQTFRIPIIKGIYPEFGVSELWFYDLLNQLPDSLNHTVIDVGVNVGQTLLKIKSKNQHVNYIGFEPNTACVQFLNSLFELNDFENVKLYPVGISNKTSLTEIYAYSDNIADAGASIIPGFRKGGKLLGIVPTFHPNDVAELTKERISLIKIDVEGAEAMVLEGLYDIIKENSPYIFMEMLPVYSKDNTARLEQQQKVTHLLHDLNYKIYRVIKNHSRLAQLELIEDFGIHDNPDFCDYLLTPYSID